MKFVTFLLVFTAMVGFNALCQEVINTQAANTNLATNSGGTMKPADVTNHTKSTKPRGKLCVCTGKSKPQRGCPCKMQNIFNGLGQDKKALCLKKGIRTYKKCKDLKIVKNKEERKYISIPI